MLSLAVITLAAIASSANALVIPRDAVPSGYAVGYLEDYQVYHTRYLALNCEGQHGTPFFDDCCHPMLASENLKDNRKAYCTPSASSSSAAAQASPSPVDPSGDPDCDDELSSSTADSSTSAASSASASASASSAPAPAPSVPANVAPAPANVAPAPAPAPAPSPSPSPAPAASPSPSSGNNGGLAGIVGQVFTSGIATFFFQNGVAGNCGTVHQDSDKVVALESSVYGGGQHCGKTILIKDNKTGHTSTGVVADSCPTCVSPQSIDLSQALFDEFASATDGTFDVTWGFTE